MLNINRLPNSQDLKSDTIKAAGVSGLLAAVVACIQFLGSFDLVSRAFVEQSLTALPYATIVLSYLTAAYRVNIKTEL